MAKKDRFAQLHKDGGGALGSFQNLAATVAAIDQQEQQEKAAVQHTSQKNAQHASEQQMPASSKPTEPAPAATSEPPLLSKVKVYWFTCHCAVKVMSEAGIVAGMVLSQPELQDAHFEIVHHDGPDRRGVDVGLLYRPDQFTFIDSRSIPFSFKGTEVPITLSPEEQEEFRTRDILMVHGSIDGEDFAIYTSKAHLNQVLKTLSCIFIHLLHKARKTNPEDSSITSTQWVKLVNILGGDIKSPNPKTIFREVLGILLNILLN